MIERLERIKLMVGSAQAIDLPLIRWLITEVDRLRAELVIEKAEGEKWAAACGQADGENTALRVELAELRAALAAKEEALRDEPMKTKFDELWVEE